VNSKVAIIPGENKIIKSIEDEIANYFNGKNFTFKTPIHLIGSSFQKLVWEELKKIPPAETRSYLDIAKSLQKPTFFRAVARANGTNQLAIIIPCHRVINSNGELGGYSGGVARKQWLLDHEKNFK
jgi:AraC family transcriptional regulator of adaptative response/methylated-DNA-[protein]-cysteine methyltransferase